MVQVISLKQHVASKSAKAPVEVDDPYGGLLPLAKAEARAVVFGRVEDIKRHIAKLELAGIDTIAYSEKLEAWRGRLSIFNIVCSSPCEFGERALVSRRQLQDYEELAADLGRLNDELAEAACPFANVVPLVRPVRQRED